LQIVQVIVSRRNYVGTKAVRITGCSQKRLAAVGYSILVLQVWTIERKEPSIPSRLSLSHRLVPALQFCYSSRGYCRNIYSLLHGLSNPDRIKAACRLVGQIITCHWRVNLQEFRVALRNSSGRLAQPLAFQNVNTFLCGVPRARYCYQYHQIFYRVNIGETFCGYRSS